MKRRQAAVRAPLPDGSHLPYSSPVPVNYNKDDLTEFDANYQSLMPVADSISKRSGTVFSAPVPSASMPNRSSTSSASTSTSNRSSLTSFLSLSTSSSETAYYDGDDELDGQTDVEDPPNEVETKDGEYSYCLLSALPMRSFAPGPKSLDAPWPYTFKEGDIALAKGGNGTWRRVTVLDGGFVSSINLPGDEDDSPGLRALAYTAQWTDAFGRTFRGTFCPTRGDIKPDDAHVRRLIAQENARE